MGSSPPDRWLTITTVDAHAAGKPLRVITGGLPPIPGTRSWRSGGMRGSTWITFGAP